MRTLGNRRRRWELTYVLTPWSRVLLEKLTGSAASQEIPRIFGTRRFITVPTSARHLSLSWANWEHNFKMNTKGTQRAWSCHTKHQIGAIGWLSFLYLLVVRLTAPSSDQTRGELSYLAPLGSENISAPYFEQCFFREGVGDYPPDSQTPRLPVPRQK